MHILLIVAALVALIAFAFGDHVASRVAQVAVVVIGSGFAAALVFFGYVLYRVVVGTI